MSYAFLHKELHIKLSTTHVELLLADHQYRKNPNGSHAVRLIVKAEKYLVLYDLVKEVVDKDGDTLLPMFKEAWHLAIKVLAEFQKIEFVAITHED